MSTGLVSRLIALVLLISLPFPVCALAQDKSARPHFSPTDKNFVERFLKEENYIPVDQIKPGMEGYGLTVFQGTRVERFDVKVIGVIRQVLSGRDAILVKTSGALMGKNNVVRGMSGSPIYINGRLAGALSYGFDFSKEPIVGITPVVDMLDALSFDESGAPRRISRRSKEPEATAPGDLIKIPVQSGAPRLVPLLAPVSLTGFSSRAAEYLATELKDVGLSVSSGTTGGLDSKLLPRHSTKSIEPGEAVAVMLSTGDFASAATGTATCSFDNKFIAFGHAFLEAGSVSFPLAKAYIHEILPSLSVSFKLASPLEIVGTIFADRPWSVGGQVGRMPEMIPLKITVSDEERGVRKIYNCQIVEHPDLTRSLVSASVMSAMDATFQSQSPYAVKVSTAMEILGQGKVERSDRFAVNFPAHLIAGSSNQTLDLLRLRAQREPVSGFVGTLVDRVVDNDFEKTRVKALAVDITVEAGRKVSRIERVSLDRGTVAPGEEVGMSVTLKPFDQPARVERLTLPIPRDLPDGDVAIGVCGGDEVEQLKKRMGLSEPSPQNLGQIISRLKKRERSDKLCAVMALNRQSLVIDGEVLSRPPAQWIKLFYSDKATRPPLMIRSEERVTRLMDDIIDGAHVVAVSVKRKDKLSARPLPYQIAQSASSAIPSDGIYMTDQARKSLETYRKSDMSLTALLTAAQSGVLPQMPVAATPAPAPTASEKPAVATLWSQTRSFPHGKAVNAWLSNSEEKLRGGKCDGVVLDSMGRLKPGFREIARAFLPEQSRIFAGRGYLDDFYFVSGKSLYRLTGQSGTIDRLVDLPGLFISSLDIASDGSAYMATAGSGAVYRVALAGREYAPQVVARVSDVCSQTLDDAGALYLGTANSGRLYRYKDGKCELYRDLGQAHVTALHFSSHDRRLYVGTAERGVVMSLGPGGDLRAEYETGEHIVTGIARDKAGNLYISTAGQGKLLRLSPRGKLDTVAVSDAFYTIFYDAFSDQIYSGDAEGDITRVEVDELTGQIYFTPCVHTGEEAVLAIARIKDRLYVGTSNIASVLTLELGGGKDPTYTSIVFDGHKTCLWSSFRLYDRDEMLAPALAKDVRVETRSGNTAQPDLTWSDWRQVEKGKVDARSRYLQYRLIFKEDAAVGATEVLFTPDNSGPTIAGLSIDSSLYLSGKQNISITGADQDSDNMLVVLELSDDGKKWRLLEGDLRSRKKEEAKEKTPEKSEAKAETKPEDMSQSEKFSYEFDTKKEKDGVYFLRVTLSDRPSNATGAQTSVAMKRVVVDNKPPEINGLEVEREGDRISLHFEGVDALSPPADATCKVEGYEPFALSRTDASDSLDAVYKLTRVFAPVSPKSSRKAVIELFDRAGNKTRTTVNLAEDKGG